MLVVFVKNRVIEVDNVRNAAPPEQLFEPGREIRKNLAVHDDDIESAGGEKVAQPPGETTRDRPNRHSRGLELLLQVVIIEEH